MLLQTALKFIICLKVICTIIVYCQVLHLSSNYCNSKTCLTMQKFNDRNVSRFVISTIDSSEMSQRARHYSYTHIKMSKIQ